MSVPLAVFGGIALIILASGVAKSLQVWVGKRSAAPAADGALEARLEEVEARLRDILDVMIALSEKVDRWERQDIPGPGRG